MNMAHAAAHLYDIPFCWQQCTMTYSNSKLSAADPLTTDVKEELEILPLHSPITNHLLLIPSQQMSRSYKYYCQAPQQGSWCTTNRRGCCWPLRNRCQGRTYKYYWHAPEVSWSATTANHRHCTHKRFKRHRLRGQNTTCQVWWSE